MGAERDDGEVLIGATSFGIFLAGEIIAFTAKPKGAEVDIGRGMGTVECRKTVLAVHAPISFILLEGNEAAEERPKLVNTATLRRGLDGARPAHPLGRGKADADRCRRLPPARPGDRTGGQL